MEPAGDTTPASKLHGAYDDHYLLRLVSQKGKPGIFAFETCLHDQGIARQGTCVSALRNLKGEPVPISIQAIASEQLSSNEAQIAAAVKRKYWEYTSALYARAQRRRDKNVVGSGLGGSALVIGGMMAASHYDNLVDESLEEISAGQKQVNWKKANIAAETDKLTQNTKAFERFITTSEAHLKNEAARLSSYLAEYNDSDQIARLRAQNASVDFAKELEKYNAGSIKRSMFNQDMVKWLDETGLPESLRKTLQANGLSIDEYLRKPSTFDAWIVNRFGNNKQAFDDVVRSAMQEWKKFAPATSDFIDPKFRPLSRHIKLGGGTLDLRGAIVRFDKFRFEFPSRFKTKDAYKVMLSNYDLNAVRIDSYDRLTAINQLFDDVAKGIRRKEHMNKDIAELMASRFNRSDGKALLATVEDLQNTVSDLDRELDYIMRYQLDFDTHRRYLNIDLNRPHGKNGLLGFMDDLAKFKAGKAAGVTAVILGFGAVAGFIHGLVSPADDHEDDWQAWLESGQVDLITDFSSSLWTPDATEHAAVPSVKELMSQLTLFQRELWFGATSDAPDVVQIVQHCLPHKMPKGGGIRAQCESVVGTP